MAELSGGDDTSLMREVLLLVHKAKAERNSYNCCFSCDSFCYYLYQRNSKNSTNAQSASSNDCGMAHLLYPVGTTELNANGKAACVITDAGLR